MPIFRFASFELNSERAILLSEGVPLPIQSKVYCLLCLLIEARDRVVPYTEIYRSLWPDVSVTASALYRLVKEARSSVGDDGASQSIIRTFAGEGLRFVAPIEEVDQSASQERDRAESSLRRAVARWTLLELSADRRLLSEVLELTPGSAARLIADAVAAGWVEASGSEVDGYRLKPDRAHDALVGCLTSEECLLIHRRARAYFELRARDGQPGAWAASARHAREGIEADGAWHAFRALRACAWLAAEEGHLEVAASALDEVLALPIANPDVGVTARIVVLLERSKVAQLSYDFATARGHALEAARAAGRIQDWELCARAVLAAPPLVLHGQIDREWAALTERALSGVSDSLPALAGALHNRLAYQLYWSRDEALAARHNERARRVAASTGDRALLGWVALIDHMLTPGPTSLSLRRGHAEAAVGHGKSAGDTALQVYAREQVANDAMELGQLEVVKEQADAIERLAEIAPVAWTNRVRTMIALHHGDFESAERLLALERAKIASTDSIAEQYLAAPTLWLLRARGRLATVVSFARDFVASSRESTIWRASLALIECEAGDLESARREYEGLAVRDFEDIRDDFLVGPCLTYLSDVCVAVGDTDRAEVLYRRLSGYSGRLLVLPRASVCLGPADYSLGRLALLRGDRHAAREHLEAAIRLAERTQARPALAACCAELAALSGVHDPSKPPRAAELSRRALDLALSLGLVPIERRLASLDGS